MKKNKKILLLVSTFVIIVAVAFVGFRVHENHQNFVRWQSYLDEVMDDNWYAVDIPYDNFLNIDYLVEFINNYPTKEEIQNMGMDLYDANTRLVRWGHGEQHKLQFSFCNNPACDSPHSEVVTLLLMMDVRYFDGLALYRLQEYELDDVTGLFSVRYGVNVSANHWGNISFTYQDVDFTIDFAFDGIVRVSREEIE